MVISHNTIVDSIVSWTQISKNLNWQVPIESLKQLLKRDLFNAMVYSYIASPMQRRVSKATEILMSYQNLMSVNRFPFREGIAIYQITIAPNGILTHPWVFSTYCSPLPSGNLKFLSQYNTSDMPMYLPTKLVYSIVRFHNFITKKV